VAVEQLVKAEVWFKSGFNEVSRRKLMDWRFAAKRRQLFIGKDFIQHKYAETMGRAFEYRKARKMKRWDRMSKAFTRIGKEIAMSVKAGGADPENNARLRACLQNAKTEGMPKDRVEAAIKRATSKDEKDYEEVVYEGYGPHGVAIVVETATDNTTRTVANIRMYFNRSGGSLGKTGSLDFLFDRRVFFTIAHSGNINPEELELELIDYGAEEISVEGDEILIVAGFSDYGQMQKALEERKFEVLSSNAARIPTSYTENLTKEQQEEVMKLIEKLEDDDDVQNVFHNMRMDDEE
jgi:YebC/PmpR family DNA-binding regulatory protein